MTSVDSGVETGNDSNDSSVNHENNIAGGSANATTNNASINQELLGNQQTTQMGLPIGSIIQGARFCNLEQIGNPLLSSVQKKLQHNLNLGSTNNTDNTQSTSLPSTSGPLVLHANAEQTKVLEFRIPPMYIQPVYTGNSQLLNAPKEIFKIGSASYERKKMRMQTVRKDLKSKTWLDIRGFLGERKMRFAAATNNVAMMRSLLSNGVHTNNHDDQGRSPLHLASSRGYTEVVRLLLEHGADPNQRDCLGNTPLHLAAVTSKIAVVTLLLKAGTDVLSSDLHGHNPLQLAQTKLRLLQNCKGSDMNRVKEEVHNVVGMLLAYLQRQKDAREQVETLSTFCSRLSLSSTSDQIQGDVRDLLANIDSLSLAS